MLDRKSRFIKTGSGVILLLVLLCAPGFSGGSVADDRKALKFAVDMALAGSWHEAEFRWSGVLKNEPENAHLYNNLAIAYEALGEWDKAAERYATALELEPTNLHIQDNHRRFSIFRERLQRQTSGDKETTEQRKSATTAGGGKKKGKVVPVTVGLPMPPRIQLAGDESILVVSFLDDETRFLDINREMVRYMRSAFRSRTAHDILDINPPPEVPEQTPEDLLANAEFWKHLHREYGADLIVSGVLSFDREDVSGYRPVDRIDSRTGQKMRQTDFVEQERFRYLVEVFFIDGPTGEPLYSDRLQRSAVVQGSQNDPITTFFELSDTIASEILAIITTRVRTDRRTIFKY